MDIEEQRLKATLKRIQNERKMGFGAYLLVPRHLILLFISFFFFRFLLGLITSDGFFLFTTPLFLTGVFFFFFLYPRYPVEYYRKETSLMALGDDRYRYEVLRKFLEKLPVFSSSH